jgi:hypothetical protein
MKPSFLSIVDKQRVADHRLNHDKTSRTDPEMAHYRRVLEPVPLSDLGLPRLPLVQAIGTADRYLLLAIIAQQPEQALLLDLASNTLVQHPIASLELVPPFD